jgi:hypothetical protein
VGTVTAPELPSPLEVQRARGAGDREVDLLVAAIVDAFDAPQRGDRETCKLSIFSASFIRPLSWKDLLGFDLGAFPLRQLKCAHLVPTKAPLQEEAILNQNQVATEKRRVVRKAQHKKCQIAKRDRNDNCNKRQKVGSVDSKFPST